MSSNSNTQRDERRELIRAFRRNTAEGYVMLKEQTRDQ